MRMKNSKDRLCDNQFRTVASLENEMCTEQYLYQASPEKKEKKKKPADATQTSSCIYIRLQRDPAHGCHPYGAAAPAARGTVGGWGG